MRCRLSPCRISRCPWLGYVAWLAPGQSPAGHDISAATMPQTSASSRPTIAVAVIVKPFGLIVTSWVWFALFGFTRSEKNSHAPEPGQPQGGFSLRGSGPTDCRNR